MRKLEIIALNATDALAAEQAGADRIELVSAMEVGGLSPELDVVQAVVEAVNIPVNVMVRLTSDSFVYDHAQFEQLLAYINQVSQLGINGLVFGGLNPDNTINQQQLEAVCQACKDLDFTFHRAIDEDDTIYQSNFELIDGKATTVLTSGGITDPITSNIERIYAISSGKTRVLVGGGVNINNYQLLFDRLPNCDFHIGSLAYNNGDFEAGINTEQVREVKQYLTQTK